MTDTERGLTTRVDPVPPPHGGREARSRAVLALAVVLLLIDAALLLHNGLFLLHDEPAREPVHPLYSSLLWNGDNDESWIELFGYAKLGLTVGLLIAAARLRDGVGLIALAAVVLVLLADDAVRLHERGGTELVERLDLPAPLGFDPQYLGEALIWAAMAPVLLALIVIGRRLTRGAARRILDRALIVLLGLVAAGVLVDVAVIAAQRVASAGTATAVVLVETSGELLLMTALLLVAASGARMAAPSRPRG
ncbi:hypothetical protein OVN20_01595 [Microcella daejeonensis]|uniref:hypothetical protein n=1 Tax=Microcella daejeonensis TaxID=2994971 RepID=UPI00226DB40D|nr:hypothetical protein [Microcella daejeonensis]WAB84295.1 hypothetical protein OVN20_01595 [Microcella daejeonensis]